MENKSGVIPVEFRVLIKPEPIEDTDPTLKKMKELGLEMLSSPKEREQMAQQRGTVIAAGGNAFSDWKGDAPKVGGMVLFSRYAGYNVEGDDGEMYRVLNDKDISAILEKTE